MLAPERRTRADIIAAIGIAVAVLLAAIVVWARGDATGTESVTAVEPATTPSAAVELPTALRELWHAPDDASERALVAGGAVVTASGGTVTGRDPNSGAELWHYRRDMPLCGVETQFGMVVAVYRDERGCSQATMLSGNDGARRTARSSYMDDEVRLSVDGTYLLAQGDERLEVWRSDLVRTVEYGYVDAPVNVKTQPRKGCTLLSAASGSSRLAVLESCPDDAATRLTVMNPSPKDNTVPEEYGSRVLTGPGAESRDAKVIAVSDSKILLYQPGTDLGSESVPPRLSVFDGNGNPIAVHELPAPMDDPRTARVGSVSLVHTGSELIALNSATFEPQWTVRGAIGTPAAMATRLLVPVPDAIVAVDLVSGAEVARIPVDRSGGADSDISLAVLGEIVLEKRGDTLYGLG
ncbi:Rv3212 family protein [Nocardia shimofusensis]|uniref:Rv3212 family protein n=1 Tax=Nocardia shimofusensis TaxID=228596 RepID=UPI000831D541|nr:PQQ-binding-like beta-propeller repeat protein [Nocardia shimofusensis]